MLWNGTAEFKKYYEAYLGLQREDETENAVIAFSENRERPINKRFIYKMILTEYENRPVLSLPPGIRNELPDGLFEYLKTARFDGISGRLSDLIEKEGEYPAAFHGLRAAKMYRMIRNGKEPGSAGWKSPEGFDLIWMAQMRKFMARKGGKIIGYCKISDIDYGYGNIVVWTEEEYRNRGIAKELLCRLTVQCRELGIEPVYLVSSTNSASVALAESAGFETVQIEYTACDIKMED